MSSDPAIRPLRPDEEETWLGLRRILWPEVDEAMHRHEMRLHREKGDEAAVLVAEGPHGLVGFAELTIRPRVEGSLSERVAYLEGWFVTEDQRGRGVGASLVAAGERWARDRGLTELASDAELHEDEAIAAHRALGFRETFRTVGFLKSLE